MNSSSGLFLVVWVDGDMVALSECETFRIHLVSSTGNRHTAISTEPLTHKPDVKGLDTLVDTLVNTLVNTLAHITLYQLYQLKCHI